MQSSRHSMRHFFLRYFKCNVAVLDTFLSVGDDFSVFKRACLTA